MKKKIYISYIAILLFLETTTCQAFFYMPNLQNLEDLNLVAATQVFDQNGQLIAKLFEENRVVVSINNISPYVQQAIIANEDSRFYNHFGIDPMGIARALWVNISSGTVAEGGVRLLSN